MHPPGFLPLPSWRIAVSCPRRFHGLRGLHVFAGANPGEAGLELGEGADDAEERPAVRPEEWREARPGLAAAPGHGMHAGRPRDLLQPRSTGARSSLLPESFRNVSATSGWFSFNPSFPALFASRSARRPSGNTAITSGKPPARPQVPGARVRTCPFRHGRRGSHASRQGAWRRREGAGRPEPRHSRRPGVPRTSPRRRHRRRSFLILRAYEAESVGAKVVRVDPRHMRTDCHACGHRQAMPLDVREFACGCCGLVTDRNVSAARNVLQRGSVPAGREIGSSSRPGASEDVLASHVAGLPGRDAGRCSGEMVTHVHDSQVIPLPTPGFERMIEWPQRSFEPRRLRGNRACRTRARSEPGRVGQPR